MIGQAVRGHTFRAFRFQKRDRFLAPKTAPLLSCLIVFLSDGLKAGAGKWSSFFAGWVPKVGSSLFRFLAISVEGACDFVEHRACRSAFCGRSWTSWMRIFSRTTMRFQSYVSTTRMTNQSCRFILRHEFRGVTGSRRCQAKRRLLCIQLGKYRFFVVTILIS